MEKTRRRMKMAKRRGVEMESKREMVERRLIKITLKPGRLGGEEVNVVSQ